MISPLLANIYLHWFDRLFHRKGGPAAWANAKLVRYADDFIVLARHVGRRITGWIESKLEGWMGLELNREKTRVVNLREQGKRVDFLGYTFRFDRDLRGRAHTYLNVFPSDKSLARERGKLREMTSFQMCFKPIPALIQEVNEHLRGWGAYFGYGYPSNAFRKVNWYVRERLRGHLSRRSQRPFRPPEGASYYAWFERMGLIRL